MTALLYVLATIGALSLLALGFLGWCAWVGWHTRRAFGLEAMVVRYRVDPWTGHYEVEGETEEEVAERFLRIAAYEGVAPMSWEDVDRLLGDSP